MNRIRMWIRHRWHNNRFTQKLCLTCRRLNRETAERKA